MLNYSYIYMPFYFWNLKIQVSVKGLLSHTRLVAPGDTAMGSVFTMFTEEDI